MDAVTLALMEYFKSKGVLVDDELPEGYKRILSMTMNDNCYYAVDDFKLKGSDTLRLSFSVTAACNVIGCYTTASAQDNYSLYINTSGGNYLRYNGGTYDSCSDANIRYDVTITPTGSSGMRTDSTWEAKDFTSATDMLIGVTSLSATSAKLKGTLYGNVEVEDTSGIRFKGIPCERVSDGEIGWYDIVGGTFYEPVGTTPTAGEYDTSHLRQRGGGNTMAFLLSLIFGK